MTASWSTKAAAASVPTVSFTSAATSTGTALRGARAREASCRGNGEERASRVHPSEMKLRASPPLISCPPARAWT